MHELMRRSFTQGHVLLSLCLGERVGLAFILAHVRTVKAPLVKTGRSCICNIGPGNQLLLCLVVTPVGVIYARTPTAQANI